MRKKTLDTEIRILDYSMELFLKFGYSRVSTDEIAHNLGASKKTIYNYYPSKKDILIAGINLFKKELSADVDQILKNKKLSFPEKLQQNMTVVALRLSTITTHFGEDLRKNVPDVWSDLSKYKKEAALMHFTRLLNEGEKSGHINKKINKHIAVVIYMTAVENLLDPLFINNLPAEITKNIPYTANEIFNSIVRVIYEGILSVGTKKRMSK